MFNYKYGSNMTFWEFDEASNEFIVTATENINQGQEVFLVCTVDLRIVREEAQLEVFAVLWVRRRR